MTAGNKILDEDQSDEEILVNSRTSAPLFSSANPTRKSLPVKQSIERDITTAKNEQVSTPELTSNVPIQIAKSVSLSVKSAQNPSISKSEALNHTTQAMTTTTQRASSMSRPLSAPVIPGPKRTVPLVSTSQTVPLLSRTQSSISRLDSEPSSLPQIFEPQSYRNAIMGIKTATRVMPTGFTLRPALSSSTQSTTSSQAPSSSSSSSGHPPQTYVRRDQTSYNPGFSSGSGRPQSLHNRHRWIDQSQCQVKDGIQIGNNSDSAVVSSRQSQGVMPDEFPHLDIINDLLDDDHQNVGRATFDGYRHHDDFHFMNQQYAFPGDMVPADIDSLNGSYPFDLPDCYYDELSQMVYDSSMPFHGFSDMQPLPPVDFPVYGNGMDALLQNQWPINSADLSVLDFGGAMDVNGYAYQLPGYSTCGLGGYNMMYQPANGI